MTDLATRFVVTNRDGTEVPDLDTTHLGIVLSQLDDTANNGQPSISLTHESGWALQAFPSGRLILTHPDRPSRHLRGASRELVAGLWASLADGDLDTVEDQPWRRFHDEA